MARPLRIEYPGALYHLTSRGDGQEDIFADDNDRQIFLGVLALVVTRFDWHVYAYCLMDNHYHLMVETPKANLSLGMRHLNGVYTQRFNHRHERVGHVFQGRFKAILVDKQSYLLELARYVVLNPIRANMTRDPARYRWSSYRATAGLQQAPEFLDLQSLLAHFAESPAAARRQYVRFVSQGIRAPSPWAKLQGQVLLGGESFIRKLTPRLESKTLAKEIPRTQRHATRPSLERAFRRLKTGDQQARNRLIAELHIKYGYTQAQIAGYLGLHYATVSRIVARQTDARNKT